MKNAGQNMKVVPCDRKTMSIIEDRKHHLSSTPIDGFTKFAVQTGEPVNLHTNQTIELHEGTNIWGTLMPFIY